MIVERVWNRRIGGIATAVVWALEAVVGAAADFVNTRAARLNLGRVGVGVIIRSGCVFRFPGQIHIGNRSEIGRSVEIGSEGGSSECSIGADVIIGRRCAIDFTGGIDIEDGVLLSEGVRIYTHSHGLNPRDVPSGTPLLIGEGAWVAEGALVMAGVGRIGKGAIVGARAVVTRPVGDQEVVAGVPAVPVKVRPKRSGD